MPSGSCLCGRIKYSYTGEPQMTVACHCLPCRKSSGTPASMNIIVSGDQFNVEKPAFGGPVKTWSRSGDSGKGVTYNFCGDCPTLLWVESEALGSGKIVKYGTLDDESVLNSLKPQSEIYCKHKADWLKGYTPAEEKETM